MGVVLCVNMNNKSVRIFETTIVKDETSNIFIAVVCTLHTNSARRCIMHPRVTTKCIVHTNGAFRCIKK